jgi:two-component system sensor kinase FixL
LGAKFLGQGKIAVDEKSSDERFRRLIENAADAVCVSVKNRIVWANRATLSLFHAERPEVCLGRSILEFFDPSIEPTLKAGIERLLEKQSEPLAFDDAKIASRDGRPADVSLRGVYIEWNGEPGIQLTLREINRPWRALIDATQDAVISIDQNANIIMFNPAAERIFGYLKSEVQGKKVNMLMAEPYAKDHDHYIRHYEATGEKRAIGRVRTVAGKRKDGTIFPIELSVAQVASGAEVNYAAFIRDISDKARLESRLLENSRLATIGATAAKLAHEIGNPLNGMYVSAQLLDRYLNREGTLPNEKIASTFFSIVKELKRLNSLVEEFRSFYHSDHYDFQPLSLATVIEDVLALQRAHYFSRGIIVQQEIPADLPLVVADSDKLKQVFLNLCKNAAESMPDGGKLTVRANTGFKETVLEISDTGNGIAEGIDIWAPFVTTKSHGTGLGLMIVRQIVADHQGSVSYSSQPGKGTTFRLTLPLRSAEAGLITS